MHAQLLQAPSRAWDNSSHSSSTVVRYKPQYSCLASKLRLDLAMRHHKTSEKVVTHLAARELELWSTSLSTARRLTGKLVTKCTVCLCTTIQSLALLFWRNSTQTSCNNWRGGEISLAASHSSAEPTLEECGLALDQPQFLHRR